MTVAPPTTTAKVTDLSHPELRGTSRSPSRAVSPADPSKRRARVGIFCADFHSPYKDYFRRLSRSFVQSTPIVFNWVEGSDWVDGIRVVRVGSSHFVDQRYPRVPRALRRVGLPISEGSQRGRAEIEECLRREQIDVALLLTGFVGDRAAEACRRAGVPFLVSFRGADLREAMSVPGFGRRMRRVCALAARTLVVSNYMIDQLGSLGVPRESIDVIPAGASVRGRAPGPSPGPDGHCVFVGRLVAWKGVDLVLRALAKCRDRGRDLKLSIVGDGPDRGDLERLTLGLGLGSAVVFHGQQPQGRVAEIIDRSGFLVLHSLDKHGGPEGFGNSVTEAMAAGRPVIVSRCGGLTDQVRDGEDGYLVEQYDVDALATAMQRLGADSSLRERLGTKARERALRSFDAEDLGRKIEAVTLDVAEITRSR